MSLNVRRKIRRFVCEILSERWGKGLGHRYLQHFVQFAHHKPRKIKLGVVVGQVVHHAFEQLEQYVKLAQQQPLLELYVFAYIQIIC